MEISIKAEHLSLAVPTYLQRERASGNWKSTFFGAMFDPPRRRTMTLLEDFNFTIREGERVALLGQNGAGKSTLLKVLNGAYAPTSGHLAVNGRVQSLVNLSLGFNGQATVRENIFLRGTAMGLASSYIRRHIDDILAFADIHEKVNQRLYTLSSGQKMRLGFAISTSIQQDVLLLDEWLSTGDANFKIKAKERLEDRVESSSIVVLASHRVSLLRDICDRGMVIDHGRLLHIGDIDAAIAFYQKLLAFQWAIGSTENIDLADDKDLIYGFVDGVKLKEPGNIRVKGWMTSTGNSSPGRLAIKLDGKLHSASDITRYERKNVARRFGIDSNCGFRATFKIPGVKEVGDLRDFEVLGGMPDERPATALRLSNKVNFAILSNGTVM